MSLLGRFRNHLRERELRHEFDEELRFHFEKRVANNLSRGLTSTEAHAEAHRHLGSLTRAREDMREARVTRWIDALRHDTRHAARSLGASSSWTAIAMLGLAIGLTTSTFAVVDALVLRPVRFANADRLAHLSLLQPKENVGQSTTWSTFQAWKDSGIFEAVGAWTRAAVLLETDIGPLSRASSFVTPGTLDLLGVRPVRGRTFFTDDVAADVVIISEELWRGAFNSDPAVIGRSVKVDGRPSVVIGVLPDTFRFGDWDTEVWRPLAEHAAGYGVWDHPWVVARFSERRPSAEALRLATEIAHQSDPSSSRMVVTRTPLTGTLEGTYVERAVPLLSAGVGLVFLALCFNVAGLLLTRWSIRQRQFALCAALGASRGRLITQALIEGAVLGVAGSTLGVFVAGQLTGLTRALLPEGFQSYHPVQLDSDVLMVAAGLAILATVLIAVVPAFISTRLDVPSSLRVLGRASTETKGARLAGRAFVVAEIGLACTLLVPAVLLVRSFVNLTAIDKGLDTRGVSIASVDFDNVKVPDRNAQLPVMTRATELLDALPTIEQVAWSVGTPAWYGGQYSGWVSRPDTAPPVRIVAGGLAVGPDFFQLYGIRLLHGRTFEAGDSTDRVVVDEQIASTLFPGLNPVGRTVVHDRRRLEVIGVVSNVRRQLIGRDRDTPALYGKFEPGSRYATISLRCRARCPSEGQVRQELLALAPALRVSTFRTLDEFFDQFVEEPRFTTNAAILFAVIALVAAAGGLFSVLSYAVGRRRREFGIRAALGASRRTIGRLVLRDIVVVGVLGLAIGAFGAWFLAETMASQQFGVTTADPISWGGVVGVLTLSALAAAWFPVRQAMRVDPALLLKED